MVDAINPKHYEGKVQPIDLIESLGWEKEFCLGSALKYITRAGKKDDEAQDIKKAIWYLERHLKNITPVQCKTSDEIIIEMAKNTLDLVKSLEEPKVIDIPKTNLIKVIETFQNNSRVNVLYDGDLFDEACSVIDSWNFNCANSNILAVS